MSRAVAKRAIAALLLLLPLAGFWTGAAFYGAGDLRQPVAAGLYEISSAADPSRPTVRVAIMADGRIQVSATDGSSPGLAGITSLGPDRHRFVVFEDEGRRGRYVYGLLEQETNGDFLIGFPMCDPAAGRAAGATVETAKIGGATCRFHDRASLEAALRRIRVDERDPQLGIIRLHRIDHGAR